MKDDSPDVTSIKVNANTTRFRDILLSVIIA
jgi:hypothetical protein